MAYGQTLADTLHEATLGEGIDDFTCWDIWTPCTGWRVRHGVDVLFILNESGGPDDAQEYVIVALHAAGLEPGLADGRDIERLTVSAILQDQVQPYRNQEASADRYERLRWYLLRAFAHAANDHVPLLRGIHLEESAVHSTCSHCT